MWMLLEVHPTHLAGDRYLGGTVPAAQVSELRLNRWPAEVALRDGRIGFVSTARRTEDYDRYVAAVRQEYASLPEAAFRAGRRAFLDRLRAEVERRGWFFHEASPLAEALARKNLAREIAGLDES